MRHCRIACSIGCPIPRSAPSDRTASSSESRTRADDDGPALVMTAVSLLYLAPTRHRLPPRVTGLALLGLNAATRPAVGRLVNTARSTLRTCIQTTAKVEGPF